MRRESNRGAQSQSIEPSSATSAAVCVSPMSAYCSIRRAQTVAAPRLLRRIGRLGRAARAPVAHLHEREAELCQRVAQRLSVRPEAIAE